MDASQLWEFPIKEFHPVPQALMGPGAYELIRIEANKLELRTRPRYR